MDHCTEMYHTETLNGGNRFKNQLPFGFLVLFEQNPKFFGT